MGTSGTLRQRARTIINILNFILIIVISIIDWKTGWEQSFAVFYLIPIAIVSWYCGRGAGIAAAIYSTVASYMADYFLTIPHASQGVALWNTLSPFIIYVIFVYLQTELIASVQGLETAVRERTFSLTAEIADRMAAEKKLITYQGELSSLAAELSRVEERERRRFATELHDQLGQNLTYVKMKLNDCRNPDCQAADAALLGEIEELVEGIIQSVRSLTFQISPPLLYEIGLEAALEWLAEEFQKKHQLQVTIRDDGQTKFSGIETRTAAFQFVRELLMNVVKHAGSDHVLVSLEQCGTMVRIVVEDEGRGFTVADAGRNAGREGGFGLFNIRQRLNHLRGNMTVFSEPGQGARVVLEIPATN